MKSFFSLKKPDGLAFFLIFIYAVALGFQVKRGEHTLLGNLALTAFLPLINGAEISIKTFKDGFNAYIWQKDNALKYEELLKENLILKGELEALKSVKEENRKLKQLLNSPSVEGYKLVVARSIVVYGTPFTRSLLLSLEGNQSVSRKSPVIDTTGVVGRLEEIVENKGRVLLINDPASAIGVKNLRSGVNGVAIGDGKNLQVKYITNDSDVVEEDIFVTSGLDNIFPPNLEVGKAISVSNGGDYMKKILLSPSASIDKVDYLLILEKAR